MMPKLLRQACPQLSEAEFFWRLYCVYGAMVYIQVDNGRMQRILRSRVDTGDLMPALEHVVAFLARGFAGEPVGTGFSPPAPAAWHRNPGRVRTRAGVP